MEFVLFNVGNIHFGIKLEDVIEIFDAPQMIGHRFLFRDNDLDVVYLSALFGIEDDFGITPTDSEKKNIIVSRINGVEKAVVVDNVSEIKRIESSQIKELPKLIMALVRVKCFWGAVKEGDRLRLLVDMNGLE
ncbi:chemotaxis protein CheW [Candidatus Desantisbacteria bacterium]|nr:chemotaxis protein CheW [Candidatus Desantisbacteria bacterium]